MLYGYQKSSLWHLFLLLSDKMVKPYIINFLHCFLIISISVYIIIFLHAPSLVRSFKNSISLYIYIYMVLSDLFQFLIFILKECDVERSSGSRGLLSNPLFLYQCRNDFLCFCEKVFQSFTNTFQVHSLWVYVAYAPTSVINTNLAKLSCWWPLCLYLKGRK